MSFFKKKTPPQAGEQARAEAIPPAYNAEAVIGGLSWYRLQYQRSMKLATGLVLALVAAVAVIALLVLTRPTPRYFAATPDLRLAPLIPLDKPVLTQQGLLKAYHRLRMTPDFAVNPFDLPLGNRKPLPSHKAFLVNLLALFCTSLEEGAAPGAKEFRDCLVGLLTSPTRNFPISPTAASQGRTGPTPCRNCTGSCSTKTFSETFGGYPDVSLEQARKKRDEPMANQ
ncbi:MAG: hypothetical protein LBN96_05395 [Desulfovibrio sp.]|jgi:hypothetical protein|nr:hypothetical protein [Desulfovibrio sp.]